MPIEMGVWRIDGERPQRLPASTLPTEAMLEDFLEKDPALLGTALLIIGRQVRTPYNKYIDLLAIDGDGNLHVLELKREKTPREVVAQILDYGSWVSTLSRDDVLEIANDYLRDSVFEEAFAETFGAPPPDEISTDLRLTVVATELDSSSERIIDYLRGFGVPINAVFFAHMEDGDRRYLARSWLAAESADGTPQGVSKKGKRAEWNGVDWFVAFGEDESRKWADGRKYGFISAGGGEWYSRTLNNLPVGARVNVHIPGSGYVGVGTTLAPATRFDEARVNIDGEWVRLADLPLLGTYHHGENGLPDTDEMGEYVVPVSWTASLPRDEAYWENGMFANQNSACKLRQNFTLERLARRFGLDDDED